MTGPTKQFHDELKAHVEKFPFPCDPPNRSVTITGIPHRDLTVRYQHSKKGVAKRSKIAKAAAKINAKVPEGGARGAAAEDAIEGADAGAGAGVGAATTTTGTIGGASAGAVISKVMLGSAVGKIGVASAGVGIGIPLLAPIAVIGGALGVAAYAGYKFGTYKNDKKRNELDHKNAQTLAIHLHQHMQKFAPSVPGPTTEVYIPVPNSGLAALWQPPTEQQP